MNIFTARQRVLAIVNPSVCLSVRQSVRPSQLYTGLSVEPQKIKTSVDRDL